MAAFLAAAAPAVPPPRASRTTKVLFTPAVPDKEDAAPEESHPPAQAPPAPPARTPLAEIVGRDSHDSAPGDPGLSKAVVSRESTPRAARRCRAQDGQRRRVVGDRQHAPRRRALDGVRRVLGHRGRRRAGGEAAEEASEAPPRLPYHFTAAAAVASQEVAGEGDVARNVPGDAAHRRTIETGAAATRIGQQAARSLVPHSETPAARVAREAAGLQPAAAPAAVFAAGAAVAAAAVAARVADGVVLPGRPSRDSRAATRADSRARDARRGDRGDQPGQARPGGLRGLPPVARRAALPVRWFVLAARGRRAAAPDARRAGGLFACCVLFF